MRQLPYIATFVNLAVCKKKIEELSIEITNSELQRIPVSTKKITTEQAHKVFKILDMLEENDDVQQVFHNMELTEEILKVMDTE